MKLPIHRFPLTASALAACLLVTACGGGDAVPPPGSVPVVTTAPADTTPPTVTIGDNTDAATATGNVTFLFTFSEDVGNSFSADDITVAKGTKGAFTMSSDGKSANLVVIPLANTSDTMTVTVAAGSFSDIAGNVSATVATASQVFDTTAPVVAKTQMALPVNFDSATVDYGFIGFGGAEDSSLAVDPADATNKVAKVVRAAGSESFAGTTVTAAAGLGFSPKIPLNANDNRMSVRVWSPDAGIPVRVKIESHTDNTKSVETEATTTVAGGWQTLMFNFATQASGTAAVNYATNYDKLSIFFDFGRSKASSVQKTYYFDDIAVVPGAVTPPVTPPTTSTSTALITFDVAGTTYTLTDFGGNTGAVVNDPAGGTGKVMQVVKGMAGTPSETWAGTTISTGANQSIPAIALSASAKTMTARVWAPAAGMPIRLKLEDAADGSHSVETEAVTTVANGWQTLTFDFGNPASGTAALNLAYTFNKASVFFNFGTAGSGGAGQTFYFDDLSLVAGSSTPVTPTGSTFATFDEATAPTLTDFGLYGTASAVVADPTGGTNKVAKLYKYLASEQWGGSTISTLANNALPTIPFTASKTTMTLRVYSPAAGVRVRLKVENASNGGINCETDAFTTASGAWETLSFNFGDPSTHYIPNGPTSYNTSLPTAPLNVANTYNKASVFFDFGLGAGGYAAMPANRVYYFDDLALAP
ncbi:hypothetical protein os1_37670 [Comamonadaceae bacterium OS-1]|nr:hypothetical protein os1_37670 [Comamonadaceae bacterium OS-1]